LVPRSSGKPAAWLAQVTDFRQNLHYFPTVS
jgi:hypothetical protein